MTTKSAAILILQAELRAAREAEQSAAVRLREAEDRLRDCRTQVGLMEASNSRLHHRITELESAGPRVAMTVNVADGGAVTFNGTAHSGR